MRVQNADGSLWPDVTREELFRFENPALPGVIFLKDISGDGTDVLLETAPDAGGAPGTWTLRATVVLLPGAMKKEDLPSDDVYLRVTPQSGKVEFHIASASSFHYSRHQ